MAESKNRKRKLTPLTRPARAPQCSFLKFVFNFQVTKPKTEVKRTNSTLQIANPIGSEMDEDEGGSPFYI